MTTRSKSPAPLRGRQPAARDKPDPTAPVPKTERKGIRSVEIGLRVLDAVARGPGPLALKDISRASGLSASQAHRYLASLMRQDMVIQDPVTGRYDLGKMAVRIGLTALNRLDPVKVAEEALELLIARIDQTAMLAVWGENGPVAVRWKRGRSLIFSNVGLGTTFPLLGSTTGRLFLAYMPRPVTEPILEAERRDSRRRGAEAMARREVEALIATIRREGTVSMESHLVRGIWAASAPVFDAQGELAAGITIVGTALDSAEKRAHDVAELMAAAREASERLGAHTH